MLTVTCVEIIDISIAQRTTCDSITANADTAQMNRSQFIDMDTEVPVLSETYLATGPIILKISKSMASVTVRSSSPT
jgi:hypothetical protein